MREEKDPKEMKFGELGYEVATLKEEYTSKLVDKDYPYPENYDKYGGIAAYNQMLNATYQERLKTLIEEWNRKGEILSKLEKLLPELEELSQQK